MTDFTAAEITKINTMCPVATDLGLGTRLGAVVSNKSLKAVSATIAYNITTPFTVTLGTLPVGAIIVKTEVNVKTVFNAGTTNVLVVGYGAGLDELVGTAGVNEASATLQTIPLSQAALSAAEEIKVKYTQTGGAATTGAADVTVYYLI